MKAFAKAVEQELKKARAKYPAPMPTTHDAYAKIAEELDEFWDEVRKKEARHDKLVMLKELIQIGAMAQRAAEDLELIDDSANV